MPIQERSWYNRLLGRSLINIVLGKNLENKNFTASVIAISIVFTLCFVIVWKEKYDYMNYLMNIVFVVIGYYFGVRQVSTKDDED